MTDEVAGVENDGLPIDWTRAQLTRRDRAAAMCCAYVRKVHCAVVRTLFQTRRHSAVVTKVVTVCGQSSE